MIYSRLMRAAGPILRAHLKRRAARGKEMPERLTERWGVASRPRPEGPLAWFHAASVGEAVALLALIEAMLERFPTLAVLITTGTVTSARILATRLPPRCLHQVMPLDNPDWVAAFLDHWRPDLAIWTESEIWPNFLDEIARRGIPAAMVNARLSARSARRWALLRKRFSRLMAAFMVRLAQSESDAARLSALGPEFSFIGNLKLATEIAPVDQAQLAGLQRAIAGRPFWLAASTHPGEDEIVIAVHKEVSVDYPTLLTIIVPRHPERGGDIAKLAEREQLCIDRRTLGVLPDAQTELYLADTLGELGLFYALSPIAFLGGSFTIGIHSPVEAARHNVAIVHGPDTRNNAGLIDLLEEKGGARTARDAIAMAAIVGDWLANPDRARETARIAADIVARESQVVDRIMQALHPVFEKAGMG
jgi:3-deoxy-D-manno-octulosonic-acid transferase